MSRPIWRYQQSTWRQWQRLTVQWPSRQPLHVQLIIHRYTPDTAVLGDVQLSIITADDDVTWIVHSVDVDDVEWTLWVSVVQTDCGGQPTDNIHDVVQMSHSTRYIYSIQHWTSVCAYMSTSRRQLYHTALVVLQMQCYFCVMSGVNDEWIWLRLRMQLIYIFYAWGS